MQMLSSARAGVITRRWPTVAAVAVAALTAYDLSSGPELAPVLAASGVVYLAAAALGRRGAAWPAFAGTFVVITAAKVAALPVDATWLLLAAAAVLAVVGVTRGGVRPAHGLPLQVLAMAGFGGAAAAALVLDPRVGGVLVALGLLGHAAWDVHHHRSHRVVTRSLAEFCAVLDTLLAVAILAVTLLG
jgi:hypothetical protein